MKRQIPREEALALANDLRLTLEPYCERIEIAGSLRRHRPTVGDIEILLIPRIEHRSGGDLFLGQQVDLAATALKTMTITGELVMRPSKIGVATWGPLNYLGRHRSSIPVDFFFTRPENWWVSLVFRTGGKTHNLKLTTGANKLGYSLNAYGCGVTHRRTGEVTPSTSERHVHELCGVPYCPPEERE